MLFRNIALVSGVTAAASVTGCHFHGSDYFCINTDGEEGQISPAPTATGDAPSSYTGCHNHGADTFCMTGSNEVQFLVESATGAEALATGAQALATGAHDHDHDHDHDEDDHDHDHDDHDHDHEGGHSHPHNGTSSDVVSGCHYHGSDLYCEDSEGNHGLITPAPQATGDAQLSYTGCHNHGTATFCFDLASSEVQFVPELQTAASNGTTTGSSASTSGSATGSASGSPSATATALEGTSSLDNGAAKAGFGAAGVALFLAGLL